MTGRWSIFAACVLWTAQASAQADWEAGARLVDEAYWSAYNQADPVKMNSFLADDVEFYHDRGGTLIGKPALAAANDGMKTAEHKLRRAAIPGTVRFFPMRREDELYGVLVTGEHQFFVTPKGQAEFAVGRAYFTQLMLLKDKSWKISRIFSYEHVDAAKPAH